MNYIKSIFLVLIGIGLGYFITPTQEIKADGYIGCIDGQLNIKNITFENIPTHTNLSTPIINLTSDICKKD